MSNAGYTFVMFTGIVQGQGQVVRQHLLEPGGPTRLVVDPGPTAEVWADRALDLGESIAVSGVCLTVAALEASGEMAFDLVAETVSLTTLGGLQPGDPVNLERSLTPSQPMGGHQVQGHVDFTGVVQFIGDVPAEDGGGWRLRIEPDPAFSEQRTLLVPKGSVTVEGVSLTLAKVEPAMFEIALIPETLSRTTLGIRKPGDRVNLESDIMVRSILHVVQTLGLDGTAGKGETTLVGAASLQRAGFMD